MRDKASAGLLATQAALSFHEVATQICRERLPGIRITQSAIGHVVDELPNHYNGCLAGRVGSLGRVALWIARWSEQGMPPLQLVVTADGARVERL